MHLTDCNKGRISEKTFQYGSIGESHPLPFQIPCIRIIHNVHKITNSQVMEKSLSPKQMAQAIGASESSVKRWCDRGLVEFTKTGGGHRRIPLAGVLEFVRREKLTLASPEALGLPTAVGQTNRVADIAFEDLAAALAAGDEERARLIVWDLHLADCPLGKICDDVVAKAFELIGDQWCQGDVEVYQERRACEIAQLIIHEVRRTIRRSESGPTAIGASPTGDPYSLPTKMVELVLLQNGWNAASLGSEVPFFSLCQAVRDKQPKLVWLSVSAIGDESSFLAGFDQLQQATGAEIPLVIGGRGLSDPLRQRLNYTVYCDKLRNLERFAATLYRPVRAAQRSG